ncbi:MAG: hypothetical protein WCW56_02245 [Candidatus Paceibacterota bacterium]|jgi:hypothetical protein
MNKQPLLFTIVLVFAMAVFAVIQLHAIKEVRLVLTDKVEKEKLADSFVTSAIGNKDFLAKLSPSDALVWTKLVKQAEENRLASGLQESWTTFSAAGVPVAVTFYDEYGVSYTAVVGTMTYSRGGGNSRFEPCLAFYVGNAMGGCERLDGFDAGSGQSRSLNEWIKPPNVSYSLVAEDIRKKVYQHLRLAPS